MKPSQTLLTSQYTTRTFQTEIAIQVGVNGAIFLQQLHYWLLRSNNRADGYNWVYHSYVTWQTEGGLEFWSPKVIRTTIEKLEEKDLVISGNFNRRKYDKTKWYRINYEKLESLCPNGQMVSPDGQIEVPELADAHDQKGEPIPKTTTEITAETTSSIDPTTSPRDDAVAFYAETKELTAFNDLRFGYTIQPNDIPYIRKVLMGTLHYQLVQSEIPLLETLIKRHGKNDVMAYLRYLTSPECREHDLDKEFLKIGLKGLSEKCDSDTHNDESNNQCPIEF